MALIGWKAKAASAAQMVELGAMNAFLLDRLRKMATIRSLGAVGYGGPAEIIRTEILGELFEAEFEVHDLGRKADRLLLLIVL